MKVSQLKLNPNNPRHIKGERLEMLKRSISEFEQMMVLRPIIVDENNVVLGGNMRLQAIKALGKKEIPNEWVKRAVELTEEQKREFVIKDNAGFGEWDWELLANEWDDLPLADWGVDVPNFELIEDEPGTADAEPQIDKAAELNEKWQVATGDLWQIGEHRLLCGDSTKAADVARLMQGEVASMIWTDPPYGVAYGDKLEQSNPMGYRVRQIENDNLDDDDLETLLRAAMNNVGQHCVKGAAIYAACPAGKPLPTAIKAFDDSCFEFRWQLVWVKDQLVLSRADYHFRHENILYGWKSDGAHYFTDDRTQDSVFEVARPKVSEEHPTMKPLDLIAQMIRNSSKQGEIVIDMFGGSGSTMLAAANNNRRARLMELTPNFSAVILERMQTAFPDLEIKRLEQRQTESTN